MPRYTCQHCGCAFYRRKYQRYCGRRCANAVIAVTRAPVRETAEGPPKESAAAAARRQREPIFEALAARAALGLPLFPARSL